MDTIRLYIMQPTVFSKKIVLVKKLLKKSTVGLPGFVIYRVCDPLYLCVEESVFCLSYAYRNVKQNNLYEDSHFSTFHCVTTDCSSNV